MPISGSPVQLAKGDAVGLMGGERARVGIGRPIARGDLPAAALSGRDAAARKPNWPSILFSPSDRQRRWPRGSASAETWPRRARLPPGRRLGGILPDHGRESATNIDRDFVAHGKLVQELKDLMVTARPPKWQAEAALPFAEVSISIDVQRGWRPGGRR